MLRTQSHRGLLLIAVLAAAGAGTLAARWTRDEPNSAPNVDTIAGLMIDPATLNFGEVHGTADFAVHLTVRNVSQRDIHVSAFRTSCLCQPVEPRLLTIPAGETRAIRVALDAMSLSPAQVGQPRRVETELRPVLNGTPAAKAWVIRGTVHPPIATDLAAVLFGESNRVGQPPVSRRVRVEFHEPGRAKVELVPAVAEVAVLPGSASTEWAVVVTPFTNREPGPFRGTLTITNLSTEGRVLASLSLPVEGVLREGNK